MMGFKPLSFALAFFFGVGVILFGFGCALVLVRILEDPAHIRQYNQLASDWTRTHRIEFTSFSFNFTEEIYNSTVVLKQNLDPDSFNREHRESLTQYDAVRYQTWGRQLYPTPIRKIYPWLLNPILETYDLTIHATICNPICKSHEIGDYYLQLFTLKIWDGCDATCCRGTGMFRNNFCYLLNQIRQVCLKVEFDNHQKQWRFGSQYGGVGCFPNNGYGGIDEYVQIPITDSDPNHQIEVDFSGVSFTLRHARDPLLFVHNFTNGNTGNFQVGPGLSVSLATLYLGFGSLVIGLILAVISSVTCFIMCLLPNYRRKYIFVNMTEEHESLLRLAEAKGHKEGGDWKKYLFPTSQSQENETEELLYGK